MGSHEPLALCHLAWLPTLALLARLPSSHWLSAKPLFRLLTFGPLLISECLPGHPALICTLTAPLLHTQPQPSTYPQERLAFYVLIMYEV